MDYYKPETYRAQESVGYLIRRASNSMMTIIEDEMAAHELSFAQWVALVSLRDGLAKTAVELSRGLYHDAGAITRLLDGLQKRKLITRKRSVSDRRVVELEITPAGLRALDKLLPMVVGRLNDALEDFTRREVDEMKRLLHKLLGNLARYESERDQRRRSA
jgi:DNA-binding MarR family transcriptional regulator